MARSRDSLRGANLRAVIGIAAAGVFLGGVAAVVLREAGSWTSPAGAEAATGTKSAKVAGATTAGSSKQVMTPSTPNAAVPVAKGAAGSAPANEAAKAVAGSATPGPVAIIASARPVESTAVARIRASSETQAAVQTATQVEDQIQYQYNVIGRRDPFVPLVGTFVGDDVGGSAPVDVGGVKVVGIVWGADSFALVEDGRGNSLILRRGDKVMNGFVEDLKRDAMIVKLTVDGQSQSVAIPLTRRGDQSNASR